jgi:cold shock CspA family protein
MSMIGKISRIFPQDGYGLIEPEDGGALVFADLADFGGRRQDLVPGASVRFSSLPGTHGPRAYNVTILAAEPSTSPAARESSEHSRGMPQRAVHILSRSSYKDEIMRALLSRLPDITTPQVAEVQEKLLEDALRHGWLE